MKVIFKENKVILRECDEFNLERTFECGQCFRWGKTADGGYKGVAFSKELCLYEHGGDIIINGAGKADFEHIWQDYFDLSLDYTAVKKELSSIHPVLDKASAFSGGIRILHQEPWEALCSFIISQNNNIPRIKKIINALCKNFGDKLPSGAYSFPSAKRLAELSMDDLAVIRAGFRAKYIIDAAQKVSSGEIDLISLSSLPVPELRQVLMKIKGVGPKVADCTMLYGMHRLECFPLDVWMKRAMEHYFQGMTPEDFGRYAGIAQQYIFHYCRSTFADESKSA